MEADLLELLRCPEDHAALRWDPAGATLACVQCGKVFPVREGIPVMLPDLKDEDEQKA